MIEPSVSASAGTPAAIGVASDAAAIAGDGSIIALLKAHRTSLATIAAAAIITGGVITAGRLDTAPAKATAVAPTYTEGTSVALSTDLAGALRTAGGGGGGNPSAGRLDSLRRIDSLRYVAAGRLDSLRRLDTLRFVAAGKLDTVRAIADRASLTTGGTIGAVQLGSSTGKTNRLLTGSITTTAVTADQVILTRTVTGGTTFYLEYVCFNVRLTALSATASILGAASLETPSGTKVYTDTYVNPTTSHIEPNCVYFGEPIAVAASVVVRCVTTPAATTSMLWFCNFGGYER
jgi:hypothetical protein